ncbi:hypothetical protein AXF42_Ash003679 [Apostasia shenzhenica]|uniref:DUF674 domain-containing protein n=1 Tax=Apostasia shenzhenica TaxID=1088818 RepID=A0A2I0AHL7_9ASPA|nr:hypothetical protein AXF42_Ash003679 [Apostasia shenzhenica]
MAKETSTLRLMVDRSSSRVVFAESDGHFVDILMSFLTYPLATILRLSNKQSFGALNKLYESVESIESHCLRSEACRSMLLQPVCSAAEECSKLQITNCTLCSYICSNRSCFYENLSLYANHQCPCGEFFDRRVCFSQSTQRSNAGVFVLSSFRFKISDDLVVSQLSMEEITALFGQLGVKQGRNLEAMDVTLTAAVIIELLKRILVSETPLTDVFLGVPKEKSKMQLKMHSTHHNEAQASGSKESYKASVMLILNKKDKKLVFAEADNEFVDLLVSYLTYPMGLVMNKLGGTSGNRCFDNLYKSIESLKSVDCFKGAELMNMLLNPKLPTHLTLEDSFSSSLEHEERFYLSGTRFYMCRTEGCNSYEVSTIGNVSCKGCTKITNKRLKVIEPKDGFMRKSRFVVMDNLVVKPLSSIVFLTDAFKETLSQVEIMNVEIGAEEVC